MPAAGLGTRLNADRPKLLVPVAGVPMIDRLLALFAGVVNRAAVVVHPSFEASVTDHLREVAAPGVDVRAVDADGNAGRHHDSRT